MTENVDLRHMKRVIALARAQSGRTGTRPAVGCAIVSKQGRRLAEGATSDEGAQHAEELALEALGGHAPDATVYVTLEPCRERSSGAPSCSERLIDAKVKRVVIAVRDPHPKGSGGIEILRAAGIEVEVGLLSEQAEALYADFFQSIGEV